jgi:tetratricopeptide (TPR) repeat protein
MNRVLILMVFLFGAFAAQAQPGNSDAQLAVEYYQAGEYDKAVLYYEKLYSKNQSEFYYRYYLKCLLELKNYKEAEKLVRKQQKKNPGNLVYYVDLGQLFKVQGEENKAKKEYDNALKELSGEAAQINNLAAAFRDAGELEYALKTYEKGERLVGVTRVFSFQKAEIYSLMGKTQEMFDEYMSLLESEPTSRMLNELEKVLALAVNFEDPANPRIEMLRVEILKRVQKYPEMEIYSDLLIWFYQQKGDLNSAFNQVRALEKKARSEGDRMMGFGDLCLNNNNFDLAIKAYEFVVNEKGSKSIFYYNARIKLLNALTQKITSRGIYDPAEVAALDENYRITIAELGKNAGTVSMMRDWARVKAFYLHQEKEAAELLQEAIAIPGQTKEALAMVKMDLADVLLMTGYIWEASLYYSQVEKDFKHDPIGHEAKFRNARIYYYTGDFEWAQAQLDVLKASTSKLISNDAMKLSLLITDNLGLDSIPDALELFAKADLLVFRNKITEAERTLDTLNKNFPWHGLADESHYLRYRMAMQQRQYDSAAVQLQIIIDQYGSDILGDDAVFKLAELYQYYFKDENKAAELYKKILFDYPGSLYVIEARKRFRQIRGDSVN